MQPEKYIDDLPESTIQQIFVPACLPYTPKSRKKPGTDHTDKRISLYYSCEDCSDKFVLQSSLAFHVNRCSLAIKYNCRQCSHALVFYNRCNFLAHLRLHNLELSEEELASLDVTTQPIPLPMMPFFTHSEFNAANNTTTDPQLCFSCPECKEAITTTLVQHFQKTSDIVEGSTLSCKFCGLILPSKCSMKAHIRIHTKVGRLICPDCCLMFPAWNLFWDHLTNVCFHGFKVLRFKCRKCTYIFKERSKLQDHFLSRHLPKITPLSTFKKQLEAGERAWRTCDLCDQDILQSRLIAHVVAHSKDSSALSIAYQCPSVNCNFCCCQIASFKTHIESCLPGNRRQNFVHKALEPAMRSVLANSRAPVGVPVDPSEIADGCTKQALELLKSKGNIVVHKVEGKGNLLRHQSNLSVGKIDSTVRMPLTPSPEPLSESSFQGQCNGAGARKNRGASTNPKQNPKVRETGPSLSRQQAGNGSLGRMYNDVGDEADVLVVTMHQCTICKEFIAIDGKNDAIKKHFADVHRGKYKLGRIKNGSNETFDSRSELLTSDLDSNHESIKFSKAKMPLRNGVNAEDSPPPLLKKQKPLVLSPRRNSCTSRGQTAASHKEPTAKLTESWKIMSIVDSDDECLLNLKNRARELQAIGSERSQINYNIRRKRPVKKIVDSGSDESPVDAVEKEVLTGSTSDSDSGPAYKRKRKRGSSSDPDFECNERASYKPKLRNDVRVPRRGRPAGSKNLAATIRNRDARHIAQRRKVKLALKNRSRVHERNRKIRNNKETKTYDSDVDDYRLMGSGLVISPEELGSKESFLCLKPECLFKCGDKETFKTHIKCHRDDDNTFQCMECGLCFVVKPTFAKHLIINHRIKDVDEYIKENDCCDKEIVNKSINELERLEKQKVENVPMVLMENQCKICFKVCEDSLSLNIHFRTHGMAFLRMNQLEKKSENQ